MLFRLATMPGDPARPNEDFAGVSGNCAILLDGSGAPGDMPGAAVVVDSIGVVVGVATGPRTREAFLRVRRGIRRLIHQPHADRRESGDDAGLATYRDALRAEMERRGSQVLGDVAF